MSTHSPLLEFTSDAFPVVPDEDAETNPGVYGLSLSRWLEHQLTTAGWETGESFPEEYGWGVEVKHDRHRLYVGCFNANEAADRWQVFAFVDTGVFGAVVDDSGRQHALNAVFEAVQQILSAAPEVRDLQISAS